MKRLLIVDDEEIVLVGLRNTLRRENYDVTAVANASAALDALNSGSFAAIITDQQMPGMTGLEFLANAKQIQPNATRILVTAVLNLETIVEAINKGEIYRFVIKPWLRQELLNTVTDAVERYDLICRDADFQKATAALNQKLAELNRSLEEQVARVARQNQELQQLNHALQTNLQRSTQLSLHVMETFYPTLGSQAHRVAQLCAAMADSLALSPEERQTLEISAWLYDIGLVGVPREVIRRWENEPDLLSDAERVLIEQHPILGEEMAHFVHHLNTVGPIIRAHHERLDGTGYPDHLEGDSIPWLSRLLAVAVSFVTIRAPDEDAIETIKFGSGSAFDPEAVRAFLRVLPKACLPRREREVLLAELEPGMVLAKGIYTANGLLLIPEGKQLTPPAITKIQNHNRIQTITQALVVFC